MEFVTLETEAELKEFLDICKRNAGLFEDWTHVGALTLEGKSIDKWYWVTSGRRVDYKIPFSNGQPDFSDGVELCLSLGKKSTNDFFFNDIYCTAGPKDFRDFKFVCERTMESCKSSHHRYD